MSEKCPTCLSDDLERIGPKGPHIGGLKCKNCGRFVRWLKKSEVGFKPQEYSYPPMESEEEFRRIFYDYQFDLEIGVGDWYME